MTSTEAKTNMENAIVAMNDGAHVFDVTIICTTDDHQAAYWMDRLSKGVITKKDAAARYPLVLAVSEDWNDPGGAGNGLGTLYAYKKACDLAKTLYDGLDLHAALMKDEISIALYHTAGKGTRLAPLPASENNNKPGVKLPFPIRMSDGTLQPLTVLEAVVKQTGVYANHRVGRLSVFWGDQVFLPSVKFDIAPTHHVDILCTLVGSVPTAAEWKEQGLEKYGVIACIGNGDRIDAAQVEKVDHPTAMSMLESLQGKVQNVGPSLGSFSLSAKILGALCEEFGSELQAKTSKLDTDPHFWMPLTLGEAAYTQLMGKKGTPESEAKQHFTRMAAFKSKFVTADDKFGLFGAVDVGQNACWWDYGLLKLYSKNSLVLLEDDSSESAQLLRRFLKVAEHQIDCSSEGTTVDDASYMFNTKIKSGGSVKNSMLANVAAGHVTAEGAIIVNCTAKKIVAGKGAILYNLISDTDEGIVAKDGDVMVQVTDDQGESFVLRSHMDIDGGKSWKLVLEGLNEKSFEQIHKQNKQANIKEIQKKHQHMYEQVAKNI